MVAASFPLFSRQMFNNMGIQWAATLLGCLAVVMIPIPVCFYLFGKQLRMKSTFAPFYERPEISQEAQEDLVANEVVGSRQSE